MEDDFKVDCELSITDKVSLIKIHCFYFLHSFTCFSICQEDSLSGERWHCKAESCEPSCPYNGAHYSIGAQLDLQGNSWSVNVSDLEDGISHILSSCTNSVCAVYDEKTFWECVLPLIP